MTSETELLQLVSRYYPASTPSGIALSAGSGKHLFGLQGYVPDGKRFSEKTIVYVGSIAKQFTASCLGLLVQEQQLEQTAPVRTRLTELPTWANDITVEHLILHTSGLPMDVETSGNRTTGSVYRALCRTDRLAEQPGQVFSYSNPGYVCLAILVERVTGIRMEEFARHHLFEPLHMNQSAFWSGPEVCPDRAAALPVTLNPAPLSLGDGGLWTTLHDLLTWGDALNEDIFDLMRIMTRPSPTSEGYAWGVRIGRYKGFTTLSHGGAWRGAVSKLVIVPGSNLTIAAFAMDDDIEPIVALVEEALSRYLPDLQDK